MFKQSLLNHLGTTFNLHERANPNHEMILKDPADYLPQNAQKLTGKTVGHVQNALGPPAAEQHPDNSLLVANLAHPVEVIYYAQQHQRVHNHLRRTGFRWHLPADLIRSTSTRHCYRFFLQETVHFTFRNKANKPFSATHSMRCTSTEPKPRWQNNFCSLIAGLTVCVGFGAVTLVASRTV